MRIIAFINEAATVKKILEHIGEATQPPRIAPARGPPLWEAADNAQQGDASAQPAPEFEFDQRIAWWVRGGGKSSQAIACHGVTRACGEGDARREVFEAFPREIGDWLVWPESKILPLIALNFLSFTLC